MKNRSEKNIRRIIIVGVMMFFASVALSYGLFIPKMEQDAVNGAGDTNAEVIKTIDRQIAFVQDYTENLALSVARIKRFCAILKSRLHRRKMSPPCI